MRERGREAALPESDWPLDWDNEGEAATEAPHAGPAPAREPAPERARVPDQDAGGPRQLVRVLDPLSEEAISNADMQLIFLGTAAGQPTRAR